MQLIRLLLCLLLICGLARAENRVDFSTQYFVEPATRRQSLHVIHPQLDLNVDAHRNFTIRLGYDVDIVTGATPRTYGAAMDVVTQATAFTDARHSVRGGAELRLGPAAIGAGYSFSIENDYRSHVVDASARVDLWGKNTTFKLGYAHNFDSVCNADNRGAQPLERRALSTSTGCFDARTPGLNTESLAIDSYYAAFSQVLSPIILTEVSASLQALDGFQTNPYRRVRLYSGAVDAQEAHPLLRQRFALQARMRIAIKKAHASLMLAGRFYWDTWNVRSGTAEVTWEQYLGTKFLIRFRGRFYQQTRALFYRDAGEARSYEAVGPVGQYFSGDRELSPFRNWLFGVKMSYFKLADERGKVGRVFEEFDLNIKLDLMAYEALSPLPPNFARSNGIIDAAIVQLGLTLKW